MLLRGYDRFARLARELHKGFARSGRERDRVLHGQESHDLALVLIGPIGLVGQIGRRSASLWFLKKEREPLVFEGGARASGS